MVSGRLTSRPLPGLRADVATMMMQGATSGGIDFVMAHDLTGLENPFTLELTIEVAGESLLVDEGDVSRVEVELYVYAVNAAGSVLAHLARRVDIELDDWGERLASGGLRFFEELVVPVEEVSLRSLVLVPTLGRYGMVVSDMSGSARGLGRASFDDPCPEWLPVAASGSETLSRTSARPLWTAGEDVEVRVPARGKIASGAEAVSLTFDSPGGDPTRLSPTVEWRRDPVDGDSLVLFFAAPSVDQGVYTMSVEVGGDPPVTSAKSEVWIVDPPREARAHCAWPSVRALARHALAEIGPLRDQAAARGGSARRRARQGYVEVLRGLGRGEDLEVTVARLVDWEAETTGGDLKKNLQTMRAAQVEVLRELVKVDRETLVPVFELHRSAYREHFRRRGFGLAGHSRLLATTVVETWLATLGEDEDPGWVADGLASLGQTADRHRMFAASQGLLERAVEIEPGNRPARLLLAMLYEKLGEYEAARYHLEALVSAAPAHAEGWLRLATLQRRLGRPEECEAALGRVIGQRPAGWILSLAYQTLAQELFDRESFGEGLRFLDEAEMLLPGDPALGLARAYALDRLGRGREAVEALDRVGSSSPDVVSSRLHYVDSGSEVARRVAAGLRRGLIVRQLRLGHALTTAFGEPV